MKTTFPVGTPAGFVWDCAVGCAVDERGGDTQDLSGMVHARRDGECLVRTPLGPQWIAEADLFQLA